MSRFHLFLFVILKCVHIKANKLICDTTPTSLAISRRFLDMALPVFSTMRVKNPNLFCRSRWGWSNSTALPASITITRSESMMVCSLCAIVRTVQEANFCLIVVWMNLSVLGSTLAVASSRTRILFWRNTARARQTIWRSPTLMLTPPSETWCFRQPAGGK
jgi:hypothetical protein